MIRILPSERQGNPCVECGLFADIGRYGTCGQCAAIADTHPKDGDVKQAPLVSGGGAEGNRPNDGAISIPQEQENG